MAPGDEPAGEHEALLSGYAVLVTRPAEQAGPLLAAIKRRGGLAIAAPMIVIQPRTDDPALLASLDRLDEYDAVIFISRNAAEVGFELLRARGRSLAGRTVYAVGSGTGACLKALGVANVMSPPNEFTSEGLLKLPGLAARETNGRRVLIVRGEGGRELLGQTLQQRGAIMEYCEVYTRRPPVTPLREILRQHGVDTPDVALITSTEALENLAAQIEREGLESLFDMQLVVAGERMAAAVAQLGFTQPPVAVESPGDGNMLTALEEWVLDER